MNSHQGLSAGRAQGYEELGADDRERWAAFDADLKSFFPGTIGISVEEVRRDYARMRLAYKDSLNQPAMVVHGGAIATLIDTVVVPAIMSAYDAPRPLFTIDMQIRYLNALQAEDAIAEGWITKRGRSIVFCDAEVQSAGGVQLATGTLTYKVGSQSMPAPQ